MPFSKVVKARVFVRCARICCLCFKQTGKKIEAAHIIAEADGGPNEDDNAIPVCFDCHEEIGSYNPQHPKGNKYSREELIQHRDRLYALVEKGPFLAMISAFRAASVQAKSGMLPAIETLEESVPRSSAPSSETQLVLDSVFTPRTFRGEAFARKLKLLAGADRAYVLDELMSRLQDEAATEALMSLATIEPDSDEALLLLERAVRQATLDGTCGMTANMLRFAPSDGLAKVDEGLREAFFQNVVDIMRGDQFEEVNLVTPAVVRVQEAIPPALRRAYVEALLEQAHSDAWKGGPAAKQAMRNLPTELLKL
jgi:hypothetical protein